MRGCMLISWSVSSTQYYIHFRSVVDSSWNVMAHGDEREGKWRGNWRMEWVASTLHTTSEHGASSTTTANVHTSAANSRLNWRPRRFKWTRPFRLKTKSDFFACAITFQQSSTEYDFPLRLPRADRLSVQGLLSTGITWRGKRPNRSKITAAVPTASTDSTPVFLHDAAFKHERIFAPIF